MKLAATLNEWEKFCLPFEARLVREDDGLYAEINVPSASPQEVKFGSFSPYEVLGTYLVVATPGGSLELADGETHIKPFNLHPRDSGDKTEIISSINRYPLGFALNRQDNPSGYLEMEIFKDASRVGYYVLHLK